MLLEDIKALENFHYVAQETMCEKVVSEHNCRYITKKYSPYMMKLVRDILDGVPVVERFNGHYVYENNVGKYGANTLAKFVADARKFNKGYKDRWGCKKGERETFVINILMVNDNGSVEVSDKERQRLEKWLVEYDPMFRYKAQEARKNEKISKNLSKGVAVLPWPAQWTLTTGIKKDWASENSKTDALVYRFGWMNVMGSCKNPTIEDANKEMEVCKGRYLTDGKGIVFHDQHPEKVLVEFEKVEVLPVAYAIKQWGCKGDIIIHGVLK